MSTTRKLSLTKRLQLAYNLVTQGSLSNRNNRISESKKSPFMWPFGMAGKPQWAMVDYNSYYSDGYAANAVIYAAIMVKVRAMAQANLVAATGTVDMPDKLDNLEHPMVLLLDRPNPYQSGNEFIQLQEVFLNLTGNAFTFLERDRNNELPKSLWPINPANVQIVPNDKGGLKGYLYNPHGVLDNSSLPILPSDMMHVKFPNPLDHLEGLGFGLSPISPLAKSGDVDNGITDFIKMFFQHGAMPTGALKLKDLTLDEDSIAEVKERWMEVYGGSSNWTDIAVLDMTMEYEKIGMSFSEMDFNNLDQRNESRILLPFGVPAELLPIRLGLEGSTFANKEEARRWFWEDTMAYEMELFLDTFKSYLTTSDGIFPVWDTSKVHALKKDVNKQVTAAKELWSMGVPANEAFKAVGLQIADYPGIELGYLPFSVIPVDNSGRQEQLQPDTSSTVDTSNNDTNNSPVNDNSTNTDNASANQSNDQNKSLKKNWTPDQKAVIYKSFDNIATSHETPFGLAADKAFEQDKRKILSIVNGQKKKSLENKASVNFPAIETEISSYLFNDSPENWRNLFTPVMLAELEDTGKFWSTELGVQFDIRNIEGEEWFTNYTTVFANPITETSNEVVHDVISQAMAEGWSNDTLANTFGDVFDYWITGDLDKVDFDFLTKPAANPKMGNRLLQWRREMIARTETTRVANAGARNLFSRWGVTKKEWLATGDERTREWHASMSGQVVAIGDKFVSGLGNKLDYPGDPNAPLNEFIQCRCTILPIIDKDITPEETPQQLFIDYDMSGDGDMNDWDDFKKNNIKKILSKDEYKELKDYSDDGYVLQNKYLRGKLTGLKQGAIDIFEDTNRKIDSSLNKFSLKENTILKRFINKDVLNEWGINEIEINKLKGMIITDNAYISTSVISSDKFSAYPIKMLINAPAGQNGIYLENITKNEGEFEFLLPRNTKFIVKEIIAEEEHTEFLGKPKVVKTYKLIMDIIKI